MSRQITKLLSTGLSEWEGFVVQAFHLDDLWQSCPPTNDETRRQYNMEHWNTLVASIEEHGMSKPVIVVPSTIGVAHEQYEKYKGDKTMQPVPVGNEDQPLNIIWGGSCRFQVAKELGYDGIDGVVIPDFKTALKFQMKQRSDYDRTGK